MWTGRPPDNLPAADKSDSGIAELLSLAFGRWSETGVRSVEPRKATVGVPQAGLSFQFLGKLPWPDMPSDGEVAIRRWREELKLAVLGKADILVLFTNDFSRLAEDEPDASALTSEIEYSKFFNTPNLSTTLIVVNNQRAARAGQSTLLPIMIHEVGHALGLEHTSYGLEQPYNRGRLLQFPMMFQVQDARVDLHPDDRATVAGLYQGSRFESAYGLITGRVTDPPSGELRLIGVYARRIANEQGKPPSSEDGPPWVFESVFPYGGVPEVDHPRSRTFRLFVPAGRYELTVRSLHPAFNPKDLGRADDRQITGSFSPVTVSMDGRTGRLQATPSNVTIVASEGERLRGR